METTIGFMYHKALQLKTGIKVNGQIHYKYLIYFAICSIIAFIIVHLYANQFSIADRLTNPVINISLSVTFSLAIMSPMLAISQTYIQLKQKESGKIPIKKSVHFQSLIIYVLIFTILNVIIIGMVIFVNMQLTVALLLSILSLMVIAFYYILTKKNNPV